MTWLISCGQTVLFSCLALLCAAGIGARLAAEDSKPGADEIKALVRQLGEDDFERRETAEKKLADLGPVTFDALRHAAAHGETEELQVRAGKLAERLAQAELAKVQKRERIPLSGVSFLGDGEGILAISSAGLARLVIPGAKPTSVSVVPEGIQIEHGEGKEKLLIVESLVGLRIKQGDAVFKAVDIGDLKKAHPDFARSFDKFYVSVPVDFIDAQLLLDTFAPWSGPLEEHLKAMDKAYGRIKEKIEAAVLNEATRSVLVEALAAKKSSDAQSLRKSAEGAKKKP